MEKEIQEILARVDHTLLRQTAAWEEIQRICEEGMEFHTASVCIPPCYVREARAFLGDRLPVCTVIGFPNGSSTTASKVFETEDAVQNGAAEIDMVISIGHVKAGNYGYVEKEIREIEQACQGRILRTLSRPPRDSRPEGPLGRTSPSLRNTWGPRCASRRRAESRALRMPGTLSAWELPAWGQAGWWSWRRRSADKARQGC